MIRCLDGTGRRVHCWTQQLRSPALSLTKSVRRGLNLLGLLPDSETKVKRGLTMTGLEDEMAVSSLRQRSISTSGRIKQPIRALGGSVHEP